MDFAEQFTQLFPFIIISRLLGVPRDAERGERGDDFHLLKERLRDQRLAQLDARLPGVVDHVELPDFCTPLSMESWVNAIDGALF